MHQERNQFQYCGAESTHPRSECSAKKAKCFKCGKDRHYGSVCKSKSKGGSVNELQTQPTDAPFNEDSTAEDYAPVYFTATVNHLKMVIVKTLNCPLPQPHIHPLWLSKELSSQISRSPVKSIQLQAATFYPCTKQQLLLEWISSWDNWQWIWKATMTAQLRILDPVLCTLIMPSKHTKSHLKWQTAKVTWSWAGSKHC